jgi:hypothetical protein
MREGLAGRTGAGEHLEGTGWGDRILPASQVGGSDGWRRSSAASLSSS